MMYTYTQLKCRYTLSKQWVGPFLIQSHLLSLVDTFVTIASIQAGNVLFMSLHKYHN